MYVFRALWYFAYWSARATPSSHDKVQAAHRSDAGHKAKRVYLEIGAANGALE